LKQVINNSYNPTGAMHLGQPGGKITDLERTLLTGFDTRALDFLDFGFKESLAYLSLFLSLSLSRNGF
jgi:hypothetical protein